MGEATVARTYAEALLDLARQDDAIEVYADAIHWIGELLRSEREFRLFLDTPRLDAGEKKSVVREALGDRVPTRFLRFLYVVIDKRRQRLIPEIATKFADLVDEHYGRVQVGVTLAHEPGEELKRALGERLVRAFEKEILPQYRIDPGILGGVIIRVGDRVMDGSLRRRLQSLRHMLMRAEMPEIERSAG